MVGFVNGLVITRLKVVPFIATLGMLGVARGVAKWVANQQTVNIPRTWLNELATSFPARSWMIFAPGVWIAIVLAILMAIILRRTILAVTSSHSARMRQPLALVGYERIA